MTLPKERCFALALTLLFIFAQRAWGGQNSTHRFAAGASDSIVPFLIVGELSLLADGEAARPEMIQGAKALAATGLVTSLLKVTVRERRPNGDSRASFPSGHTSAAFCMATVIADYHPRYAIPAYAIASTIGWSRVEVDAHQWRDVIAGAALGYFTAKHFTNQYIDVSPRGVGLKWNW